MRKCEGDASAGEDEGKGRRIAQGVGQLVVRREGGGRAAIGRTASPIE
jgi:hypothetical protein